MCTEPCMWKIQVPLLTMVALVTRLMWHRVVVRMATDFPLVAFWISYLPFMVMFWMYTCTKLYISPSILVDKYDSMLKACFLIHIYVKVTRAELKTLHAWCNDPDLDPKLLFFLLPSSWPREE